MADLEGKDVKKTDPRLLSHDATLEGRLLVLVYGTERRKQNRKTTWKLFWRTLAIQQRQQQGKQSDQLVIEDTEGY